MNCYKKARLAAGYTQVELSKVIHVTQGSISQWETGDTSPDIKTLVALADLYGISIDVLVGHSMPEQPDMDSLRLSEDEQKLIDDYRNLNEQGQAYIRQTMYIALPIYIKHSDNSGMGSQIG